MLASLTVTAAKRLDLADYEGSAAELGLGWQGVAQIPRRDGHSPSDYARLLMVCGVLTIKLGNVRQAGVESAAKDMLSMSVRYFADDPERHSAELWLGVVYYLCGEFNEAIALADGLLAQDTDVATVFDATMIRGMSECALGQVEKSLETYATIDMLLPVVPDLSKGKFYLNRGMSFRRLDRPQEAITDYSLAAELFEQESSLRWEGAAANNLAGAYTDLGDYDRAHVFVNRAISLFTQLKDKAHLAKSWDQSARICLKQGELVRAEKHARNAVDLLSGDNYSWRAEALITHGVALSRLGAHQAQLQLLEAVRIGEMIGDTKQANEGYQELWNATRRIRRVADDVHGSIRDIEKIIIQRTLEKHGGHVWPTAKELGLNHSALNKKLAQFQIPKSKRPTKKRSKRRH